MSMLQNASVFFIVQLRGVSVSASAASEVCCFALNCIERVPLPVQLTEEVARGASPSRAVWSDSRCLRDWTL